MNSKISKLTLEELMDLAGDKLSSADHIIKEENPKVSKFIRELGIKDGSDRVPNFVVFHHYKKLWKPTGNKLSKIGFLRNFSKYFTKHRTNSVRYYKLDGEQFDLTKEGIENARKWNARYEARRKKEKQKKKAKASGTKQTIQS